MMSQSWSRVLHSRTEMMEAAERKSKFKSSGMSLKAGCQLVDLVSKRFTKHFGFCRLSFRKDNASVKLKHGKVWLKPANGRRFYPSSVRLSFNHNVGHRGMGDFVENG